MSNPECGIAVLVASPTVPTSGLCAIGTASAVDGPEPWLYVPANSPIGAGKWYWSCANSNGETPCMGSAGNIPGNGAALDSAGDVGKTSYITLPFQSTIWDDCWACTAGLEPMNLFAMADPNSQYWDTGSQDGMGTGRTQVEQTEAAGQIVPTASEQRWDDTWLASFPSDTDTVDGQQMVIPSWLSPGIDSDRNAGNFPNIPEFVAWRDFYTDHPQYWDITWNDSTEPGDWESFNGQWGFISPLTPLDPQDCPPDMTACTWGDTYAYLQGITNTMSGGYGLALSDFSDSFPYGASSQQDFNPRIVAAFAAAYGISLPAGTPQQQASWIVANAYNQWDDYLSQGYGHFFNALATRIAMATGRQSLIIDQAQGSPLWERPRGTDMRILATEINPKDFAVDNANQVSWGKEATGALMIEVASTMLDAAYEPLIRQGANLEAIDSNYWADIATSYPTLSNAQQTVLGYRLMKRLWTWAAFAHVADRSGNIRRAIAFASRDYWDAGSLTASQLQGLQSDVQGIVPARPFGPAIYFSNAGMRQAETFFAQQQGTQTDMQSFTSDAQAVRSFTDSGGPAGYYVSDAALSQIHPGSANAPSAWIVPQVIVGLDAVASIPPAELSALKAIAPVIDVNQYISEGNSAANGVATLNGLPNQPLTFSTQGGTRPISQNCASAGYPTGELAATGLTGFGFYDTANALILVVSNPSTCPDAVGLSGTMNLNQVSFGGQLGNGEFTLNNLFTGASSNIQLTNGAASVPLNLAAWDTQLYALTPAQ